LVVLAAHSALFAQEKPDQKYEEPPEEDGGQAPKEYTFNPLQSAKEIRIGNFYFKKGSYKAAVHRFDEALKWNPSSGEAALRLGDAKEKLKDKKGAQEAYKKYLELEPDGKEADSIKKKLDSTKAVSQ